MALIKIAAWTFDVGAPAASAEDYAEMIIRCVEHSWEEGADVVLLPEYCWLGAEPLVGGGLLGVAAWFWQRIWPQVEGRLARPDKAVVLGTVPFLHPDGTLRNRAPILAAGAGLFQDKLALTPWEDQFAAGSELLVWQINGLRVAVLVCLDVEVPEWSALLRGQDLHLILVPSATETLMGVERIGRCASARAVELGCAVVVAHLVGRAASALIDENIGQAAMYLPSQAFTAAVDREQRTLVRTGETQVEYFELDAGILKQSKLVGLETNPARLVNWAMAKPEVKVRAQSKHQHPDLC